MSCMDRTGYGGTMLLRVRRQQLIDRDEKLAELETQVEHFLSELADRMEDNNTADGCRKMVDRFLNSACS